MFLKIQLYKNYQDKNVSGLGIGGTVGCREHLLEHYFDLYHIIKHALSIIIIKLNTVSTIILSDWTICTQ